MSQRQALRDGHTHGDGTALCCPGADSEPQAPTSSDSRLWADDAAMMTLGSPTATVPTRWPMATLMRSHLECN
jgi:hypothetical protein